MPDDIEKYTSQLRADFPGLEIKKVKVIGEGWDHAALEVNDSIIFRIPHDNEPSASVRYEIAVLKHLQGKLPIAIPNPTFTAPNEAYFGYRKLPGELLMAIEDNFTTKEKRRVREDWVDIAAAIHAGVSVEFAKSLKVPVYDPSAIITNAKKTLTMTSLGKEIQTFASETIHAAEAISISKQGMRF